MTLTGSASGGRVSELGTVQESRELLTVASVSSGHRVSVSSECRTLTETRRDVETRLPTLTIYSHKRRIGRVWSATIQPTIQVGQDHLPQRLRRRDSYTDKDPLLPRPRSNLSTLTTACNACTHSVHPTRTARGTAGPRNRDRGENSTFSKRGTSARRPSSSPSLGYGYGELMPRLGKNRFVRDSRVDPSTLPWEDQLASKFCPSRFVSALRFAAMIPLKHLSRTLFVCVCARRRFALQRVRGCQPQALQIRSCPSLLSFSLALHFSLAGSVRIPMLTLERFTFANAKPIGRSPLAHRRGSLVRYRTPHVRFPPVPVSRTFSLHRRRPATTASRRRLLNLHHHHRG